MAWNTRVRELLRGIYEALNGETTLSVQEERNKLNKEGKVFEYSAYLTLASGASAYATIEAGSTDVTLFDRLVSFDEEGVSVAIYRDGTYTGGTDASDNIFCTNDKLESESEVTFTSGVTATDVGTQSASTKWCLTGDANNAGGGFYQTALNPQIIAAGDTILLAVTNLDTVSQDVAIHLSWAEENI